MGAAARILPPAGQNTCPFAVSLFKVERWKFRVRLPLTPQSSILTTGLRDIDCERRTFNFEPRTSNRCPLSCNAPPQSCMSAAAVHKTCCLGQAVGISCRSVSKHEGRLGVFLGGSQPPTGLMPVARLTSAARSQAMAFSEDGLADFVPVASHASSVSPDEPRSVQFGLNEIYECSRMAREKRWSVGRGPGDDETRRPRDHETTDYETRTSNVQLPTLNFELRITAFIPHSLFASLALFAVKILSPGVLSGSSHTRPQSCERRTFNFELRTVQVA